MVVDGVKFLFVASRRVRAAWNVEEGNLGGAFGGFHPGGDAGVGHQVGAGTERLPGLVHGLGHGCCAHC